MIAAAFTRSLRLLLADLPGKLPVTRIDRLWLFPPRDLHGRESGLVVASLFIADSTGRAPRDGMRELFTIQYDADPTAKQPRVSSVFTSQGLAPADRIPRLIEGVLARLGDQREDPATEEVAGDLTRWTDLLARIEDVAVDRTS